MEYQYIVNPKTGRKCSVNSTNGKQIINNYVQSGGCGGSCSINHASNPIMSGGSIYRGSSQSINYLLNGGSYQVGGGNCSLCGAQGATKATCPLNPAAKNPNPAKHNSGAKAPAKAPARAAVAAVVARVPTPPRVMDDIVLTEAEEQEFKQFNYQAGTQGIPNPRKRFIDLIKQRRGLAMVSTHPKGMPPVRIAPPPVAAARPLVKGSTVDPDRMAELRAMRAAAPVAAAPKRRGPTGPRPVKAAAELSVSAKGTSRERCERQTLQKYTKRASPPYPASACCVEKQFVHIGNDGGKYYAKQAKDGSCRWQKCKPEYPGCPQ